MSTNEKAGWIAVIIAIAIYLISSFSLWTFDDDAAGYSAGSDKTTTLTIDGIAQMVGISMEPTLDDQSFVLTCSKYNEGCEFDDLEVGDVIMFHSHILQEQGDPIPIVIHKIIDKNEFEDGSSVTFDTAGDNTQIETQHEEVNEDMYMELIVMPDISNNATIENEALVF
jgi:hypothetical protein